MMKRNRREREELRMFENRLFPLHEVGTAHPKHKRMLAAAIQEDVTHQQAHTLNKNLLGRWFLNSKVPESLLPEIGETRHLEYVSRFLSRSGKLREPKKPGRFRREPSLLTIERRADGGDIIMKHSDHHGDFKPVFSWHFDDTGKITGAESIED